MKNFADAAFEPEVIEAMTTALDHAVASLPEPVSSAHVSRLAEAILRTAKYGERRADVLASIALLELQITPRDCPLAGPQRSNRCDYWDFLTRDACGCEGLHIACRRGVTA